MEKMQKVLGLVKEWEERWGFRLSVEKSKTVVFGNKRRVEGQGLTLWSTITESEVLQNFKRSL